MIALHAPPTTPAARAQHDSGDSPASYMSLESRIWHLYCQGHSHTAIGEQVGLERHAVARHIRAIQNELAAEHADDLELTRQRATEASFTLLALSLDHLATESQREDALWHEYELALAGLASAAVDSDHALPSLPVTHYRAGRTRLLSIALAALRHAIRLSGLEADSPAGSLQLPNLPDLAAMSIASSSPVPGPSASSPSPSISDPRRRPPDATGRPGTLSTSLMPRAHLDGAARPVPVPSQQPPVAALRPTTPTFPAQPTHTEPPAGDTTKRAVSAPSKSGTKWNTPIAAPLSFRQPPRKAKPRAPGRKHSSHR